MPLGLDEGVGILVWSPLAGGLLSGKYRRDRQVSGGRWATGWDEPPIRDWDAAWRIIEALVQIGDTHGVSSAQVALRSWRHVDRPQIEHWTGKVDVVHATCFVGPPSRAPVVVTVHDLAFARFPDLYGDVRGLMTMPPAADDPEASRPYFKRLAELAREHGLRELSMGTTQDYRVGAEEGATLIRVGAILYAE